MRGALGNKKLWPTVVECASAMGKQGPDSLLACHVEHATIFISCAQWKIIRTLCHASFVPAVMHR